MLRPLIAAVLLLLVVPPAVTGSAADDGGAVAIDLRPVALAPDTPELRRAGALAFVDGWQLSSSDKRFGGISAMAVDGERMVLLSDDANLFGLVFDPTTAQLQGYRLPVPDTAGPSARKQGRDSESMAVDPDSGTRWIAFEGTNEIRRFGSDGRVEARVAPAAMADWPGNGGAEAMVRLGDGRFIVFAEEAPGPDGSTAALLFDRDPTDPAARTIRFGYRAPEGHRITDAAVLPDGSLIVLNRRYTALEGVSIVVVRLVIDPVPVADAVLTGSELARLAPPLSIDNMEAVAVDTVDRRTIIWMVSDDNFSRLQRTLVLRFTFGDPSP